MAKVTLVFAVLLIALGLVGYFGTGSVHPTALIPTWFGVALGFFGLLAIGPNPGRRKLFMHINVTIGLVGFIGAVIVDIQGALAKPVDMVALESKSAMAALLLIYVLLCVRSFIAARRSGKV